MNVSVNESDGQWDDDYYDAFMEWDERQRKFEIVYAVLLLASVVSGTIFNIIAVVVLVRRRLWKQHEGYLYLLAIFIGNIVAIIVSYLHRSLLGFRLDIHYRLENASEFTCKLWRFLYYVFCSTGWYTSGLLLNTCLRGRLAHNTCCTCWHRVASKYCTVVGSLVVNVFITSFFVIMNCWNLWTAELVHYHGIHEGKEVHETHCHMREYSVTWLHVSISMQAFVPVCFVIPALWILAVWTCRRRGPRFALIVSDQDDRNDEAKVFVRLSVIVGAVVFLLQFPAMAVELWSITTSHGHYYQFIEVVMLIFTAHIVIVPLCFLAGGKQMRDELRFLFTGACCRRNSSTIDRYRALPLESIESPSTETIEHEPLEMIEH